MVYFTHCVSRNLETCHIRKQEPLKRVIVEVFWSVPEVERVLPSLAMPPRASLQEFQQQCIVTVKISDVFESSFLPAANSYSIQMRSFSFFLSVGVFSYWFFGVSAVAFAAGTRSRVASPVYHRNLCEVWPYASPRAFSRNTILCRV